MNELNLMNLTSFFEKDILNIKKLISKNSKIALFGAGTYGHLCLSYIKENNYNVVCFIDNDINKQGKFIDNIPIYSINEASGYDVILISSFSNNVISSILAMEQIKVPIISFDKWIIFNNIDSFIELSNTLNDDISKKILNDLLISKVENTNEKLYNIYNDKQYFGIPEFCYSNPNEIFLDAGAFVGDTIEKFIYNTCATFKKIYGFEPGEKQFKAMKLRMNRLIEEWSINNENIILEKIGLSNYIGNTYFETSSSITSNFVTKNSTENQIIINTIDNYLNGEPITFLKADVEGEELNMLKGASETIKKYKPKMAISVYHKPNDLITIPQYIKKIVPEYRLALRHHSITFTETVLYCWTEQSRAEQSRYVKNTHM